MQIFINDKQTTLNITSITLESLLNDIQMNHVKGIAIAVNGEVITRDSWKNHYIQDNDKLIVIKATQGG